MEPKFTREKEKHSKKKRKIFQKSSKMTKRKEKGKEGRNTSDVLFYFKSAKKNF
jgi:hypothetical protein